MRLKNEELWNSMVEKNTDLYGKGIITYSEQWASLMEQKVDTGYAVSECAEETSKTADTEGITGYMYGCAVSVLSQVWKYGEELRRWHNKDVQIGDEGDRANDSGGVLNPAILDIG